MYGSIGMDGTNSNCAPLIISEKVQVWSYLDSDTFKKNHHSVMKMNWDNWACSPLLSADVSISQEFPHFFIWNATFPTSWDNTVDLPQA